MPSIQAPAAGGPHLLAGAIPPVTGPAAGSGGGFVPPLQAGGPTQRQASVGSATTMTPVAPPPRIDPPGFITPAADMRNPALHTPTPTKHFDVELPQQETEALRRQYYAGNSPTRFHAYRQDDSNARSSLPQSLTRAKRKHAGTQLAAGQPLTAQAIQMAQNPGATLADADAQRNHVVAAASAQTVFTGMMVEINSGDPARSVPAKRDALELTSLLTADSQPAMKKVRVELEKMEKAGKSASNEEVGRSIARVSKWAADHQNNVDFGNAGRNMLQGNRADGTVSPQGTRMTEHDYRILEGGKRLAVPYIGQELADFNFNIPSSPGGTLQSSKRVSSTHYSHPAMPTAPVPPPPLALPPPAQTASPPQQPVFQFQPPNPLGHGSMASAMTPALLALLHGPTTTATSGMHSAGGPAPAPGGKDGHQA
ncbi:hypothetical protein [Burkholderia plantarii]|uniref:hypothetical protein n=1 Tax=Burkholderia plantarii TaxID=41899 RepID=UPI0018DDB1AB|nr:hypothetical protein [Burkholderia plantarii]MBI0329553.1 hypothetical protein [Burkholderia plantarii]